MNAIGGATVAQQSAQVLCGAGANVLTTPSVVTINSFCGPTVDFATMSAARDQHPLDSQARPSTTIQQTTTIGAADTGIDGSTNNPSSVTSTVSLIMVDLIESMAIIIDCGNIV